MESCPGSSGPRQRTRAEVREDELRRGVDLVSFSRAGSTPAAKETIPENLICTPCGVSGSTRARVEAKEHEAAKEGLKPEPGDADFPGVATGGVSSASSVSKESRGGRSRVKAKVYPGCQGARALDGSDKEAYAKNKFDVCEVCSPPSMCTAAKRSDVSGGWSIDMNFRDPVTGNSI